MIIRTMYAALLVFATCTVCAAITDPVVEERFQALEETVSHLVTENQQLKSELQHVNILVSDHDTKLKRREFKHVFY